MPLPYAAIVYSGAVVMSRPNFSTQKGVLYLLADRLKFDADSNKFQISIGVKWKLLEPFVDENSGTGEAVYGFTVAGK
jgi:hypothetical protein